MRADLRGFKTKIQSLGVKIRCLSLPFPRHPRSIAFEFEIKVGDRRRSWRLCGFVRDRFSDTIISHPRSLRSLKPRRSRRKTLKNHKLTLTLSAPSAFSSECSSGNVGWTQRRFHMGNEQFFPRSRKSSSCTEA
jgi:hypothetical protein